jgi:hypothetical protein
MMYEKEILKQLQDLRARVEEIESKIKDLPMIADKTKTTKKKKSDKTPAHWEEDKYR